MMNLKEEESNENVPVNDEENNQKKKNVSMRCLSS